CCKVRPSDRTENGITHYNPQEQKGKKDKIKNNKPASSRRPQKGAGYTAVPRRCLTSHSSPPQISLGSHTRAKKRRKKEKKVKPRKQQTARARAYGTIVDHAHQK